jgi:hypothetical protein
MVQQDHTVLSLDRSQYEEHAQATNRARGNAIVKRLRLATCVAICATLLVSGCAGGTATITGTLVGADGACLYVRGPDPNGTDLYWLRHLPSDYVAMAEGLAKPDGSLIKMGDSLTVSGTLSSVPFDRQCNGAHTLDATRIKAGSPPPSGAGAGATGGPTGFGLPIFTPPPGTVGLPLAALTTTLVRSGGQMNRVCESISRRECG